MKCGEVHDKESDKSVLVSPFCLTMLFTLTRCDYVQVLPEDLLSWSFRIGKMLSGGWNAIRFYIETFIHFKLPLYLYRHYGTVDKATNNQENTEVFKTK